MLAPGASADRSQPALVAVDRAATAAGFIVERMDFPYRKAGKRAPDRAPVLVQAVVDEAERLAPRVGALVLGGRSMGGRMCSLAVAEGTPAGGTCAASATRYTPRAGRTGCAVEHFPRLRVPCLFVSGTRDAFGSLDELEDATRAIRGPVSYHWLDGKAHGLRGADEEVASVVVGWLRSL